MGLYAGIDPGKQGYASVVDGTTGAVIEANQQPLLSQGKGDQFDIHAMNEIVKRWKGLGVKLVMIELQTPQGGVRASAQTGFMQAAPYFLWRGLLVAHDLPYQLVQAGMWKKIVGVMAPKKEPKKRPPAPLPKKSSAEAKAEHKKAVRSYETEDRRRLAENKKRVKVESVKTAQGFFPGYDLRRTDRCTGPDDNKCESLLLAVAASRVDSGYVSQAGEDESGDDTED